MPRQQRQSHADFDERNPLDIQAACNLFPLFHEKQAARPVHKKNDARPKQNGKKRSHATWCAKNDSSPRKLQLRIIPPQR